MANPDRIDFTALKNKTIVNKLERHNGRDIVINSEVKPGFDLDAALAWCKNNGYTVRKWDGGARAFKGKPWVIRSKGQIMRLRANNPFKNSVGMDFAYDG